MIDLTELIRRVNALNIIVWPVAIHSGSGTLDEYCRLCGAPLNEHANDCLRKQWEDVAND